MEVSILNLQSLFVAPARYEIPAFQRQYVWTHADQWDPLWEDVRNTAENYLERDAGSAPLGSTSTHFLGAVVLQQKQVSAPTLQTRLVVDGQQRLITLQLLLDAVQEVLEERRMADPAKRLEQLVQNNKAFCEGNPDFAFKVWPTPADQEDFRCTMRNHVQKKKNQASLITQAHEFFKDQVSHWLDERPQDVKVRVEALEQTVSKLLELVVINLSHSDDPHVIFETLNARGTPLLQSDLIKNMILHEANMAGVASDSEEGKRLWCFDDDWWREEIGFGRLLRPRVDVFLNYWLILRKREEIGSNDVFSVFRRYYQDQDKRVECIADDLRSVGETYHALETEALPNSSISKFTYRWKVMKAGVLTPVLLWLLSSDVPQTQMEKSIRALESHLMRRMICHSPTRGYYRLFINLVTRLEESGPEHAGETIVEYLRSQKFDVGEWPNDRQLESAFLQNSLYRMLTRGRLRIVLEGIEEGLRTDKAESESVPPNLTIEHIMPQDWRHYWVLPPEPEGELNVEEERDRVIHTIGNLTLVNKRLNPALSNGPWESKREILDEHSTLFLNKNLLATAPKAWNESAIEDRARRLCQIASRVWPYADKL